MKFTLFAVTLMTFSSFAFAHGCPVEMKKIDAKIQTTKLNASDLAKVKDLRAQGESEHKAGKHTESMASLAEANKLLSRRGQASSGEGYSRGGGGGY